MKTFTALCLSIVVLSVASVTRAQVPCPVYGNNPPKITLGLEFLLCYMANEELSEQREQYQDIYLASLGEAAEVRVTCKYLNIDTTFQLGISDTTVYHVSRHIAREQGALIYTTEAVDSSCIYVKATKPIICYGMNHKWYTADAFLALPRHTAGLHHLVMSYPNSAFNSGGQERASEFVVAAWEDSTTVVIKPTTITTSGTEGTLTFRLNQFESVQIQADPLTVLGDMTGSTVTADKPIVLYGGHQRAEVPVGYTQPGGTGTSRDHLAEQMPPMSTWGTRFVASSFYRETTNDQEDLLRVLASDDGTAVRINDSLVAVVNAGQFYQQMITGPVLIETSGPALAAMFAHSTHTQLGTGDPFMAVIPPIDQYYNDFPYFISNDPVYTDQHVMIITERSGVGRIRSDEVSLPALSFKPVPGSVGGQQFSIADLILPGGLHRVRTDNLAEKGITIVAYGWGEVDSYGYTAGSLLKPIQGIIAGDPPEAGIPRGGVLPPKVWVRNILSDRIYFDKATIELDDAFSSYDVQLKKHIALDTRYIERGENLGLDLVVTPPNDVPIHGTMKVEYHTSRIRNLKTRTVPFTIEPQATSSVGGAEAQDEIEASIYPNPVLGSFATVSVALRNAGPLYVRLLDATGREVYSTTKLRTAVGIEDIRIDTRKLRAGIYTCEIALAADGTTLRRQLVIMK